MPEVSVNGTQLYYEEYGPQDGTALIFSHSLFFDHTMFHHQVERFSSEYRVVVYDHRGQGRSAAAPLEGLDMDTLAEDAAALIEELGFARCHFVGNSMGGFIAVRLAARRPDLLLSAVAMGSSADFGPLVVHPQQHGPEEIIDALMYIMFGDTSLAEPGREELREHWRGYMLGLPTTIGDAAHGVVYRKDVLPELTDAWVPVLAVAGEEDHAYEPEYSRHIAEVTPDARWVIVEKAGHSVAVERPEAVNEHLAEHFSSTTAPSPSSA